MIYQDEQDFSSNFREVIVRRVTRSFLDIFVLRLVQAEPMWGYKIIKKTEKILGVKIRHGALYPLLNSLETKGFVKSKKTAKKGRVRKVYKITPRGKQLVDSYHDFLKEQLRGQDVREA